MEIKELFVPYELALLAKEKGFNEPCFGHYYAGDMKLFLSDLNQYGELNHIINHIDKQYYLAAPLYQQLIDWFREKYNIELIILSNTHVSEEGSKWEYSIYNLHSKERLKNQLNFNSYYESLNKVLEEAFKLI